MKKNILQLFILLIGVLCPSLLRAQTIDHGGPNRIWTVPTVYDVDQKVTFYFDMTDSGFKEGVDLYLWCWNPSEPDADNWENSSDFAKLTYDGENVYHLTMIPTKYFSGGTTGKTEQEIYDVCQTEDWPGFWARLKTRDGGEESDVFQAPDSRATLNEFKKSGKDYQIYSAQFQGKTLTLTDKFTKKSPMTILFNPELFKVGGKSMNEFKQQANFGGFKLHSGLNDWTYLQSCDVWIPQTMEKIDIYPMTNGFYAISIADPIDFWGNKLDNDGTPIPNGLDSDTEVYNLTWLVVGILNNDWGGTCPDQASAAGKEEEYPDPEFSYFPSKISALDILTITRKWNRKSDNELTYTITAGSQTFTGTLTGTRDKREASINLLQELNGSNASSINIQITNALGAKVLETTLPLVPLSEITNE